MDIEEKSYLWQHFVFNADQRLKAFNFFVVFSVFANGGVFAAIDKKLPGWVLLLIGGFICLLATVFWLIDIRSKRLVDLAVPGLKRFEAQLPEDSRLFHRDASAGGPLVRYTLAFRILFVAQLAFGAAVAIAGLRAWAAPLVT